MRAKSATLDWLGDHAPSLATGVTWGVPWPEGAVPADAPLTLSDAAGREVPVQSWPLAYWPDGSLKWSGQAALLDGRGPYRLTAGQPSTNPKRVLAYTETSERICIEDGDRRWQLAKQGRRLLTRASEGGRVACAGGELVAVCERRERSGGDEVRGDEVRRRQTLIGVIEDAELEQAGPLRAVVRWRGVHRHAASGRTFLPFVLRLYIYAGSPSGRFVHTFIYDGDPREDRIAGLGLRFAAGLEDPPPHRHAAFAVDPPLTRAGAGVWLEPVQNVPPRQRRSRDGGWPRFVGAHPQRPAHVAGEPQDELPGAEGMPLWDCFTLLQDGPDQCVIRKGIAGDAASVEAWRGRRAGGAAALHDRHGGLAVQMRDFWQSYPSAVSIAGAGSEQPWLEGWFWPPAAEPSDLRHYSPLGYGGTLYECGTGPVDERCGAHGIARTSELTLWTLPGPVDPKGLAAIAAQGAEPPLLVCEPEHYHRCRIFGVWSLPDHGGPVRAALERKMDALVDLYRDEVDRSSWYGFWDYGDFMHSWDPHRKRWRYDEGGWAWSNTEFVPGIWLWYHFLRTGRADAFRLAEAMSRHTGEVDCYHTGPFQGIGSRHNVTHWGCMCIEVRISMAGNKRFHYYLTGDERTGELLDHFCDAWPWEKREILSAPWWACMCWNWVTAWERTGDTAHRDRLTRGMKGILAARPPLLAGCRFIYDPETGEMEYVEEQRYYDYLMTLPFGGPEIWMEMVELLDHHEWAEALVDLGRHWARTPEERRAAARERELEGRVARFPRTPTPHWAARLIAYAAARSGDAGLARKAWALLLDDTVELRETSEPVTGRTIGYVHLTDQRLTGWHHSSYGVTHHTPHAVQWGLNVMECLALIGDHLDDA